MCLMCSPVLKADKGLRAGSCNRKACQKPGATWFNRSMMAWYCADCSKSINDWGEVPLCVKDESVEAEYQARINGQMG